MDLVSTPRSLDGPVLAVHAVAGQVIVVNGLGDSVSILDAAAGQPVDTSGAALGAEGTATGM